MRNIKLSVLEELSGKVTRGFQVLGILIVLIVWAKITGDRRPLLLFIALVGISITFFVVHSVIGEVKAG